MGDPFDLRVVPLASVMPHEESEPRRVAPIVGRLRSDRPVAELNEWLRGLVAGPRAEARIRYYPEGVYVLDD